MEGNGIPFSESYRLYYKTGGCHSELVEECGKPARMFRQAQHDGAQKHARIEPGKGSECRSVPVTLSLSKSVGRHRTCFDKLNMTAHKNTLGLSQAKAQNVEVRLSLRACRRVCVSQPACFDKLNMTTHVSVRAESRTCAEIISHRFCAEL